MAVLGVDIGGSTIKAALVDLVVGDLAAPVIKRSTPQPAPPDALAPVVAAAVRQASVAEGTDDRAVDGPIGCTFPGRIRAGTALTAVNLSPDWVGQRPADLFEDALGGEATFHVLNDADAAGLAEMRFGAGRDRDGVVLVVTLGTGIGSALFLDGALVPNTEFGEIDIEGQPAEAVASRRAADDAAGSNAWVRDVGRFLQRLQDVLDPELIIIGGGASDDPEVLKPALRQPCEVVPATLGNAAGVIGAALYASQVSQVG